MARALLYAAAPHTRGSNPRMFMKLFWKTAVAAGAALSIGACNELEDPGATAPTTTITETDTTDTAQTDTSEEPDVVAPSPVGVTGFNAIAIENGGETAPLTLSAIPPFSHGATDLTFWNQTGGPITLESVTLEVQEPAEDIEFALTQAGRTERLPVETTNLALAADEGISFGIHFVPLASGARDVKVRFKHTAGDDFVVTVRARGRDNATFSPVVSADLERILGRSNVEHSNALTLGGLAADSHGDVLFSGNAKEWSDAFNNNLVFGKVRADGSLAWLHEWNEEWEQAAAPTGNNGQTGGPGDSLDVDAQGDLYATGWRVSCARTGGAPETAFVISLDTNGNLRWVRSLSNGGATDTLEMARQYMRGYVVDATLPDRVLVAGRVTESGGYLVSALSKVDGSTLWAVDITGWYGGESRVGGIAVDAANGTAYIGGILGNGPVLARLDDIDTAAPTLAWTHDYQLGMTGIHGMFVDGDGLVTVLEHRGSPTVLLAARIAQADGSVVWSKSWSSSNNGDTDASLAVVKHQGTAVFGGRVAIKPFDTEGDGFLFGLDPATGAYRWGAFHYGGKGAEEIADDYVVALASTPAGLWALHQQTPGSHNEHHFWGRWYEAPNDDVAFPGGDGANRLVDAELVGADVSASFELRVLDDIKNWDTAASDCADGAWVDWTDRFDVKEPVQAEADGYQTGTHGLLQRLSVDQ